MPKIKEEACEIEDGMRDGHSPFTLYPKEDHSVSGPPLGNALLAAPYGAGRSEAMLQCG